MVVAKELAACSERLRKQQHAAILAAACAICFMTAQVASAADWAEVGSTDVGSVFVDNETIVNKDNVAQAWIMWQMLNDMEAGSSPPKKYRSAKQLQIFDCPARKIRTTQGMFYSGARGTGALVESYDTATDFKEVARGSIAELMLQHVCARAIRAPAMQISAAPAETAKPAVEKIPALKDPVATTTGTLGIKKGLISANVRGDGSTLRPPIAKIYPHDTLQKVTESGDWVRIRFTLDGKLRDGWIRKDVVESR
jgi:hypothetical protein